MNTILDMLFDRENNIQRVLRIPDFQRGYSWEERQILDFWNDLQHLRDDKMEHFYGIITLAPVGEDTKDKWIEEFGASIVPVQHEDGYVNYVLRTENNVNIEIYDVIDGQQRLSTAFLLFKCIVNHPDFASRGHSDIIENALFRVPNTRIKRIDHHSRDNLKFIWSSIIYNEENNVQADNIYSIRLQKATNRIIDLLKDLTLEQLIQITDKLLLQFICNIFIAPRSIDASSMFEMMNNRGHKISETEVIKNRLIYIAKLIHEQDRFAREQRYTFEQYIQLRTEINENFIRFYSYLSAQARSHIPLPEDVVLKYHSIVFNDNYDRESLKIVQELFTPTNANRLTFGRVREYAEGLQDAALSYRQIKDPGYEQISYNITKLLRKILRLPDREWVFALLMAAFSAFRKARCTEQQLENLLVEIERALFCWYGLAQNRPNVQNAQLCNHAISVYHGNENINQVIEYIGTITNNTNVYGIFQQKLANNVEISDDNFKYLLYEYEKSIANGQHCAMFDELSVKKIIPLNVREENAPDCWNHLGQRQERIDLFNNLGNIILTHRTFPTQPTTCYHTWRNAIEQNKHSPTHQQRELPAEWNKDTVLQREEKLLQFIRQRWRI